MLCLKGLGAMAAGNGRGPKSLPARKVLTLVRLTDGRGAAGLQGLHRPCTCVLTSVSRQTPDASVSIIP
jgi:hypothetical protein